MLLQEAPDLEHVLTQKRPRRRGAWGSSAGAVLLRRPLGIAHRGSVDHNSTPARGLHLDLNQSHVDRSQHRLQAMSTFDHKGVPYTISKDEDGTYRFEFSLDGTPIKARVKTKLVGMVIRKAQERIGRELRKRAK